jgi:hypothetical protein
MAQVGFYRYELRKQVARVFGIHEDVATGGSTTTIVDTKLARFANDSFIGQNAFILYAGAAPPALEYSWVTDFVKATGVLTVNPAFTTAVEAGDTYQLYQHVTVEEINDALQQVCLDAEIITKLTPTSSALDYYVSGAKALFRRQQMIGVWVRPASDHLTMPYEYVDWKFEDAEGHLTIRIKEPLASTDELWLHYYGGDLTRDDCVISNLPMRLIRARAVVYLVENLMARQNQGGMDRWGTLLRYWEDQRTKEERIYQRVVRKVLKFDWEACFPKPAADTHADTRLNLRTLYQDY